jgi:restriction endonuclease S subunit
MCELDFRKFCLYFWGEIQFVSKKAFDDKKVSIIPINSVVLTCTATIGKVGVTKIELTTNQQINSLICDISKVIPEFLAYFLKTQKENLENLTSNSGVKHINMGMLNNFKIPLPPLEIQNEIVKECQKVDDEVQKANETIEAMKQQIENEINSVSGETVKLSDIGEIIAGQSPSSEFYNEQKQGLPFYQGKKDFGDVYLKEATVWTTQITKEAIKNDLLISVRAPVGNVNLNTFNKICIGRGLASIRTSHIETQKYLFNYINHNRNLFKGNKGTTFDAISTADLRQIKIPFPPLEIQKQIVSKIEVMERKISEAKKVIDGAKEKKEAILEKYLK